MAWHIGYKAFFTACILHWLAEGRLHGLPSSVVYDIIPTVDWVSIKSSIAVIATTTLLCLHLISVLEHPLLGTIAK